MTNIKLVMFSCLISILSIVALERVGFFHGSVYDCDSADFAEFPLDVQKECVRILENELRDLIKEQMKKDAKKGITQI
jgi:hypothetical protein